MLFQDQQNMHGLVLHIPMISRRFAVRQRSFWPIIVFRSGREPHCASTSSGSTIFYGTSGPDLEIDFTRDIGTGGNLATWR